MTTIDANNKDDKVEHFSIPVKQSKIHFISDTHTKHRELELPGGEILVHCGDFMSSGYEVSEVIEFLDWLEYQDYDNKILIAGNHDRIFEDNPKAMKLILSNYPNIKYLQDSSVTINKLKFYGTPWTPEFCGWGFAYDNELEGGEIFSKIPEDTDIVISHGPSYGRLDVVEGRSEHLGCQALHRAIERVNPKIFACGHIHSGFGVLDGYGETTTFINASCLDEGYNKANDYVEFIA